MPPVSLLSQHLNESHLTENMQGEYHMFIATPNERLNYSVLIYRRNWHIISVLTSS